MKNVDITKGQTGANTLTGDDGIGGIIITAPAPSGYTHGDVVPVFNMVDVKTMGITPEFDETNDITLYRQLSEFYRMGGEGRELYIMILPQTVTMVQIVEDTTNIYAKKMLIDAAGKIRQLAVSLNITVAATALNGMNADVYNAIPKAQLLHDWSYSQYMPVNILLEGRDYSGPASTAADLRDIPNLEATKVSVIIGQDWSYAETKTGLAQNMADVGTALGILAKARINQNIGENKSFNLTDAKRDAWIVPGLSNHKKNSEVYSDLTTLDGKGFVFGLTYAGYAGARWNSDHVCAPVVLDAEGNMNEHTIAYGRTADKAVRGLRTALLEELKTVHPTDKKTGLLPVGVVSHFEGIGDGVFADMEDATEITAGKTTVDPTSDILIEKELKVAFAVVPYGSVNAINGTLNLKTSI